VGMKLNADLERTVLGMSTPAKRLPQGNPRERLTPDPRWVQAAEPISVTVAVAVSTPNPLNGSHGHWSRASALAREQVRATLDALEFARLSGRVTDAQRAALALGCAVRLRRVCPSPGLADDALEAALKHVRDACAQWLLSGRIGERDSDKRLVWGYEQSRLGKSTGVVVTLTRE
jgi:hypothetical protein